MATSPPRSGFSMKDDFPGVNQLDLVPLSPPRNTPTPRYTHLLSPHMYNPSPSFLHSSHTDHRKSVPLASGITLPHIHNILLPSQCHMLLPPSSTPPTPHTHTHSHTHTLTHTLLITESQCHLDRRNVRGMRGTVELPLASGTNFL